jgi:UDP-N-acetyl-2-amino-2-deoxyglucuronate dehydrogenase
MKTWNFGIIGTGSIAELHAKAIADLAHARLVACWGRTRDKAAVFAERNGCQPYGSYEQMLADPAVDVVTICTPSGLHMEPTVAAARAGKHVLCEKPLEIGLGRIDAMIAAHGQAGTRLGGIFPLRYLDMIDPIRQAIQAGRLGRITCASVFVPWWRSDAYYTDSWHGTWALDGGGALMNQSIHMVDLLCHLRPPIECVQAFAAALGHPRIEAEDTACAAVRYQDGALGMIYGTTASYPGRFRRLEITGDQGTIVTTEDSITTWEFASRQPEDEDIRRRFCQVQGGGGVSDPKAIGHTHHTRNFAAFLRALEGDDSGWISGQEARKAVQVVLAIYESSRESRLVRL